MQASLGWVEMKNDQFSSACSFVQLYTDRFLIVTMTSKDESFIYGSAVLSPKKKSGLNIMWYERGFQDEVFSAESRA